MLDLPLHEAYLFSFFFLCEDGQGVVVVYCRYFFLLPGRVKRRDEGGRELFILLSHYIYFRIGGTNRLKEPIVANDNCNSLLKQYLKGKGENY